MGERRVTRDALGEVEHLILLAIVRLGDSAYGVSVRQEIEHVTGREVAMGALYTSLDRLARKGFIKSTLSDPIPERGGKSRRYYRLRPAGVAALRQSRERLLKMWTGVSPDLRKAGS
jgi:PadR family transcriptional regulator, regulatory protein PadR